VKKIPHFLNSKKKGEVITWKDDAQNKQKGQLASHEDIYEDAKVLQIDRKGFYKY